MYYSRAGGRIEPRIRIGSPADPNARRILGDVRMELDAVSNLTVWMTTEEAEALSRDLIEHLYDKGALSMEAAERLVFLGNSVLADDVECGEHPYPEWPCPTCDICDKSECSTPEMVWNGDTGNHVACETTEKCGEPLSWNGPGTHPCVRPKGHEGEHTRFEGLYPADIEYTEPPSIPAPGKPQSVIYLRPEGDEPDGEV